MNLDDRTQRMLRWGVVLLCAAIAVGGYWQTLHYIFLSDDTVYITENPKLQGLQFSEVWRLFVEPYNHYAEFLPLRELSYWFDMTLFGVNPAAFRVHNIVLYLLSLPLVYVTTLGLWRYFRPQDRADAPWAATAVTALFALNPTLVESVVWISGRKYMLPNVFALLALWCAINARREYGLAWRYALGALLAFAAMMLSKATYVTLAPVIVLLWWVFWRDMSATGRRFAPLLWSGAIMALAAVLLLVFIASNQDQVTAYWGFEALIRTLSIVGWLVRLAVTPETRHFYYPVLDDPYLPVMVAAGAVVLAAVVASALLLLRRRRTLEGFAVVMFILLCLPYMQLFPYAPPFSVVSDRFLSLAAWPVIMLIVALSWRLQTKPRILLLLIIALMWGYQTIQRPRDWISLEALIDTDMRAYPGYYMPVEHKIIDVQLRRGLRREAIDAANTVIDPDARNILIELVQADYAVHEVAVKTGNPQEAMDRLWKLEQGIKLPSSAKWNTAMHSFWGRIGFMLINEWEFLSKQFPDAAPVHYNAALWLLKVHKYQESVVHWRVAVESPLLPEAVRGTAYKNYGLALLGAGQAGMAEAPLLTALQQNPPDFRAYCALADVYKQIGRMADAASAAADCERLAPKE